MNEGKSHVLLGTLLSFIIVVGALYVLGFGPRYTAAFLSTYVVILTLFALSEREILPTRLTSWIVLCSAIIFSVESIMRDTGLLIPAIVILVALWLLVFKGPTES